jgi:hypothetical protein
MVDKKERLPKHLDCGRPLVDQIRPPSALIHSSFGVIPTPPNERGNVEVVGLWLNGGRRDLSGKWSARLCRLACDGQKKIELNPCPIWIK